MTVSCFLQVVCESALLSAVRVRQCLVFFGLCMTVSCFLQVVFDIVLLSAVCV